MVKEAFLCELLSYLLSHLLCTSTSPEFLVEWCEVRPIQLAVARKLLSHVCAIADSSTQNLDLGSFDRVSFLILVPPSEVTFQQTVLHLWSSGKLYLQVLTSLRESDDQKQIFFIFCALISGVLGSLEQGCASKQEAERYVVKMDHSAQARIESLIHEAQCNSYTLYILVHDHAHWDIHKYVYSFCTCSVRQHAVVTDQVQLILLVYPQCLLPQL